MKVTVNSRTTINVGDYSNIHPNLELTIDNVKLKDFENVHFYLEEILTCMYKINTLRRIDSLLNMGVKINRRIHEVYQEYMKDIVNIENHMKECIDKLEELDYTI